MNRKRVVCYLMLALLVVGFASALIISAPPKRHLSHENYSRIRVGMTMAEVEDWLGGPPGNYGRYANGERMMTLEGFSAPPGSVEHIWCDDANQFIIHFDHTERVVGHHKRAGYSQSPGKGIFDRLRALLGI